jgi:hypothetical protein
MKLLAWIAFAIAVAATATATACSATPSTPNVAASPTSSADPVAFARCMRSHGLPNFPDPNTNGNIQASSGPGSGAMNQNSPQYASAYAACKSLMPPTHSKSPQFRNQLLNYAKCMRAHGLKDFPDPNSHGELVMDKGGDLNPSSPLFQRANNACKQYQPGGGHAGTGGGTQPGGH